MRGSTRRRQAHASGVPSVRRIGPEGVFCHELAPSGLIRREERGEFALPGPPGADRPGHGKMPTCRAEAPETVVK